MLLETRLVVVKHQAGQVVVDAVGLSKSKPPFRLKNNIQEIDFRCESHGEKLYRNLLQYDFKVCGLKHTRYSFEAKFSIIYNTL